MRTVTASIIVGLTAGVAYGQTVHEQIAEAWRSRQDRVQSIEFQITSVNLYPKGSQSAALGLPKEKGPVPAENLRCTETELFVLDGTKVRTESDGMQWSGTDFRDIKRITILDGHIKRELELGLAKFPAGYGKVFKGSDYFEVKGQNFRPLVRCYRGVMPGFRSFLIDDLHSLGRVAVDGHTCERFILKLSDGAYREYWLDPARDWIVVREVVSDPGRYRTQLDIAYEPHPECGWVPKAWDFRHLRQNNNTLATTNRYTVTSYTINPTVTSERFALTFPAGAKVLDDYQATDQFLIAQADGGYVTQSGEPLPGTRAGWVYAAWGVLAFLAALVAYLLIARVRSARWSKAPS